jgi:hypothetical protein
MVFFDVIFWPGHHYSAAVEPLRWNFAYAAHLKVPVTWIANVTHTTAHHNWKLSLQLDVLLLEYSLLRARWYAAAFRTPLQSRFLFSRFWSRLPCNLCLEMFCSVLLCRYLVYVNPVSNLDQKFRVMGNCVFWRLLNVSSFQFVFTVCLQFIFTCRPAFQ